MIFSGGTARSTALRERDELLLAVPSHAVPDTIEDIERSELSGRAVAFAAVGHRPAFSGLSGRPGWVRSSAWISLFSSIETTTV
jgi:hypothetical protein